MKAVSLFTFVHGYVPSKPFNKAFCEECISGDLEIPGPRSQSADGVRFAITRFGGVTLVSYLIASL